MDFPSLHPKDSPTARLLSRLEYHVWDPDDFPCACDRFQQLDSQDPVRGALEAVVSLLISCDRLSCEGFRHIRRELLKVELPPTELDFVEFHFRRRVTGWQDFLAGDWSALRSRPGYELAAPAISALKFQASLAAHQARFTEFATIYLEGLYRHFLCNLMVLPYGTGLTRFLGEFVTRTANEAHYLNQWGAEVRRLEASARDEGPSSGLPPSLQDHWLDALVEIGQQFSIVPNPRDAPSPGPSEYRAHMRMLADTLPTSWKVHVPADFPEARFLPWFERCCTDGGQIRYGHTRISDSFSCLENSNDEDL